MRYVAEYDESVPDNDRDGKSIVIKTTDGPGEPEPLFWTGTNVVHELIRAVYDLIDDPEPFDGREELQTSSGF